jgi:hypothetical protein
MGLPSKARVEATPNFLDNLRDAEAFFTLQDAESAGRRMEGLKAGLREMVLLLGWSPANGRPARFSTVRSAQARLRLTAVKELAQLAGLPELREYVLDRHVVLYAHSETEVVLLALRHQRQLTYITGEG